MKRWIYIILIILFAAVFAVSAFVLVRYYSQSRDQQSEFDQLAQLVAQQTVPVPEDPAAPTVAYDPFTSVTHPVTGETVYVLREYAPLFLENPHTVGWMHIPSTKVNYPVMQTPDAPNYYLKRSFSGEPSAHGCLYAQENCDLETSDNVVIYGHNMRDGSMFAALHKYQDKSFFLEHGTIIFNTLFEHRTYEILSVFNTSASEGMGFSYHTFTDAADEAEFDQFVNTCKALSFYDTGVTAQYGDRLITLSTCEYSQTNGRLVVVAKLLENGRKS